MPTKAPKRAIFAYKPATLLDAGFGGTPLRIHVATTIMLDDQKYAELISDLTKDRAWIEQFSKRRLPRTAAGETPVIEVKCPGQKTLYIDPEGSAYARNVGIEW